MQGLIPRELLKFATDDELAEYEAWLIDEADAQDLDTGEWLLQPRQQLAEDALADLDPLQSHELLFGGMVGGGKSDFILWHAYNQCLRFPGLKVIAFRRTFPELRRSLVIRSLERFDRDQCKYLTTQNTWKFNNGSSIEFGYIEADKDAYNYESAEYDIVLWDELTQWPTDFCYTYMFSRVRSRVSILARGFVPHVISATNPGRVGGAWVKARFVDPMPAESRKVFESEIEGVYGTRIFIPSRLDDNKYINKKQYIAGLANLKKAQRDAMIDGSWDSIEGQYFTEWDRSVHVVEPFEIPPWWTRLRCIDYGHFAPWCCLWIAFDQDGDAVVYREGYATQLTPSQQCAWILGHQEPGEQIVYSVIDPSTFAKTGVGLPIAQQYIDAGVPCRRALNARVDGWARVREFLVPREIPGPTPQDPPTVKVGLRVFSNCTNLIRTLPMLVHDDIKPEDLDSDGEDHAPDALRYGLMSRPPRSRRPASEPPNTPEGRMAQHRKQRELQRTGRAPVDHPDLGAI